MVVRVKEKTSSGGQVSISTVRLTAEDVLSVADGADVTLSPEALEVIVESRAVVDAAVARGDAIYGVTTWVGHARDQRIDPEALEMMQPALVEMHVGALGPPMSRSLVRAGMVTRLNGIARGGAGASVELAQMLVAMLNQGIHPVIPQVGSVGSGDLGQLAYLGRAILGMGRVELDGETMDSRLALQKAGLEPVPLKPKDALAIISSNALTVGHGILLTRCVAELLKWADLIAALSMEAIGANPSVFDPSVAGVRFSHGQVETSQNLAAFLSGSQRVDAATASVQDPLSFRVVPQVHGACRDALTAAVTHLTDELNAKSDNPLVDIESGRLLSNGNFHAMNVALSSEALNLALCHVGLLSQRRMGHVWDKTVASMDSEGSSPQPTEKGAPAMLAGLALRYPAAAKYTRLRQLAQPITLDVPPLDLSVEDHATNAAEALQTTSRMVEELTELMVIESLIAFTYLASRRAPEQLGTGTTSLLELLTEVTDSVPDGTPPHVTLEKAVASINAHRP